MRGLPAINKVLVSLLPKNDGASESRDFHHVSLIHGVVKIFDKILATRLAEDLPRLVRIHRSAFVRGRSIHKNFMLVQAFKAR